ncbi:hypothetical protein V7S43_010628 [Phytophthora oleae]|uniref:Myb-like domain-containing protein n=1 Tax=Phytophthora oleae TaxID=2107226 RepID=A0ABD3FF23_9STRA
MSDLPSPAARAPPKTRKKRYCFRAGDDLLFLQTVLHDPDIFSPAHGRRGKAWEVITDSLNRQGITSTGHSLRCRLKRLVETFQEEVSKGKQATEFTPLEKLLDEYTQTDAQYQQKKAMTGIVREQPASEGNNSRRNSMDSDEETTSTTTQQCAPVQQSPPTPARLVPSTEAQSTPENGKKSRKRRFVFGENHDVLLLKVMLADRGITTASGTNKPAWKNIEAAVNSHGLPVSIHTIRTHLGILVNTYRRESHTWDFELSEKQQLMRAYCKKLDGEEQSNQDYEDHSYEPAPDADGQNAERVEGTNQAEPSIEETTSNSTPAASGNTSQRDTPLTTENLPATQYPPDTEAPATEPASKRQKMDVETILQRFVGDQNKRQEEEREQERARLNEHQELQRQTINLQKRSLDIQEKAMNMQERLMALMEKVMDKLG